MSKRKKQNTKTQSKPKPKAMSFATAVGPEDLAAGDYITITRTTHEYVTGECDWKGKVEPSRVTMMNGFAGWPYKVVAVAMPFAIVVDADGDHMPIDTRRHQLARVATAYGRATFKSVSKGKKKSK